MLTIIDVMNELKNSGISFAFDFDKMEIRMYRDLVHPESLGDNKYPKIEEKFYTKGTYPLTKNLEESLLKAMKLFSYDSGKCAELYRKHLENYMGL